MSKSTTKASYLDLIAKRTGAQRRTVRKPLCLDLGLWDAYIAAKSAHDEAVAAEAADAVKEEARKRRYADQPASEATAETLTQAAAAMEAMSLWVTYRVPSAIEQDKLIPELDKLTEDDGEPIVKGGSRWMIEYLARCFDHAETVDGERVDDFTNVSLRNELAELPAGLLLDMHSSVARAIVATDFPTLPRP